MTIPEIYELFLSHRALSTDTRLNVAGSLFFALRGETFNGNEFAREAISKGAAYAVVDEGEFAGDQRFIKVEDTLVTLQELARFHRQQIKAGIIAITGSNGKTTTKELIREILAKKYKVCATEGNLNNHIGVPLSLLRMPEDMDFGIIEMGANHIGEIDHLCHIAQPGFGIITNIGRAHLEGFGSLEGVKQAKGELYNYLSGNKGKIFINAGNDMLMQMAGGFKGDMIKYGNSPDSLCSASVKEVHPTVSAGIRWSDQTGTEYTCSSGLVGSYNLENILAAACVGRYFDVNSEDIIKAIEEYDPGMMRSQLLETDENLIVVDTYNANPSSMQAAILDFAADPHPYKILVLGEMKELGDEEMKEHERLIGYLADKPFDKILLVGTVFSKLTVPDNFVRFDSVSECEKWLEENRVKNAKILLKGSRLVKLEELIKFF